MTPHSQNDDMLKKFSIQPQASSCWRFPKGLFGLRRSTRSFAKGMVKCAAESGTWSEAWHNCEKQSVLEGGEDIWVSDRSRWYGPETVLWRLNDLHIEMKQGASAGSPTGQYEYLVGECLDELWFCTAILADGAWYGPFGIGESPPGWAHKVMSHLVRWLPEMQLLSGRISNLTTAETGKLLSLIPGYRYQWAVGLVMGFNQIGVMLNVPPDREDQEWDLVDELVRLGAIRLVDGRTELAE